MADALLLNLGGFWGPITSTGAAALSQSIDGTTDGVGFRFQTNSTNAITHLGFRYTLRTGTPPTYKIALEGLDTAGLPDGTIKGGASPASATFTPPADTTWDGTWQWIALDNSYTPTRGELLAITIRYDSGTINGTNYSQIAFGFSQLTVTMHFPLALQLTAGTWAGFSGSPVYGYRTASGRYGYPIKASGSTNTTVSTTGNRHGMFFTLPSGWGSTYQVLGMIFTGRLGSAAGTCKMGLWQTDGTELQGVTFDSDIVDNIGSEARLQKLFFDESTLADLSFGTKYYIALECIAAAPCGINNWLLGEAADRSAYPNGLNQGIVTYNGSTWTEDDTLVPCVQLILNDITLPSGGGIDRAKIILTGGIL